MPMLRQNQIIAALPRKDKQHLLEGCERIELINKEVLSKSGDPIRHVYFPIDCSISLLNSLDVSDNLEIALIGNEGMHGISLILGVEVSPLHASVQVEGTALRMSAETLRHELQQSPRLLHSLNCYMQVRTIQQTQLAICNRYHMIEARLARRLLIALDRSNSYDLKLTHELLALMLGVRRVSITKAAASLQERKIIHYNRGVITVLNRRHLEAAACECYRADKRAYNRIMPLDRPEYADAINSSNP